MINITKFKCFKEDTNPHGEIVYRAYIYDDLSSLYLEYVNDKIYLAGHQEFETWDFGTDLPIENDEQLEQLLKLVGVKL